MANTLENRIRLLQRFSRGLKDKDVARAVLQLEDRVDELISAWAPGGAASGLFTSTASGIVPASGGGSTNFLRADGSWAAPPSGGEVNTASNVGTGAGVWKDKSGFDLRFRSILAGTGVTVTQNTNEVLVEATTLADSVALGVFGSGSDGNLVFDGVATVLGIVPAAVSSYRSGAVQQYVMTRDIYADNLTVNSGVLLFNDGYRVFVKGTLTLTGFIGSPGNNGTTTTGTTQALRTSTIMGCRLLAGGTAVVVGPSSAAPPDASNSGGGAGAAGGGGNGGTGQAGVVYKGGGGGGAGNAGGAGQAGGTVTVTTASDGALDNLFQAVLGRGLSASTQRFTAATGGGAGNQGNSATSGAAGGGGSPVAVIARKITGAGQLLAYGGNGGAASVGAVTNPAGGGGAGAGCFVICVINNGSFPTIDVTGGAGGAGAVGTTTTGGTGGAGGVGFSKLFKMST